jgi:hypothetical protein
MSLAQLNIRDVTASPSPLTTICVAPTPGRTVRDSPLPHCRCCQSLTICILPAPLLLRLQVYHWRQDHLLRHPGSSANLLYPTDHHGSHYLPLYVSILSPASARPAHEPYWTGVGRDLKAREIFFWPEPGPKCCF